MTQATLPKPDFNIHRDIPPWRVTYRKVTAEVIIKMIAKAIQ